MDNLAWSLLSTLLYVMQMIHLIRALVDFCLVGNTFLHKVLIATLGSIHNFFRSNLLEFRNETRTMNRVA